MTKNFVRKHYDYLKDNSKGYWFKRKIYGWGWVPVRWQGWLFLLIWMILFAQFFMIIDKNSHSASDTLIGMLIPGVLLIILLFLVCYGAGEKPRWSWGFD